MSTIRTFICQVMNKSSFFYSCRIRLGNLIKRKLQVPLVFLLLVLALSISNQGYGQEKLYTKLISITGPKENEKRDSTFAEVIEDPFAIALHSINQGEKYRAQRTIERPKPGQEFRMITLFLSDT